MNIRDIKVNSASLEERLMRYCRIDTQSNPENDQVTPSSEKQFNLARILEKNTAGVNTTSA